LKDSLYDPENLDEVLDRATILFVISEKETMLDKDRNLLFISPIFKWYKGDFEKKAGSIIEFIRKYLKEDDIQFLDEHSMDIGIKYMKYDWNLNIADKKQI
jgi:hypothetical protein